MRRGGERSEGYRACMDELARRELARRDYGEYLRYVNGRSWKQTRFSALLAREVQSFVEADSGNAYDILLIEAPPQHGKSAAVTEALPSWFLGRHPDRRVILVSYSDETAERFARRNREKVARYGRTLFGVELGEVRRKDEFEVTASADGACLRAFSDAPTDVRKLPGPGSVNTGATPSRSKRRSGPLPNCVPGPRTGQPPATRRGQGSLISRGMLAGITGNPAELLLIDDPVKNRMEADSENRRRLIWDEWLNTLKTRLAAGAKVVVIMTPWHEDDLAGRLLKNEPGLKLLRLPVEAEAHDPLGREPGEPLCPELGKGERWLEQFRRSYLEDPEGGARAWAALYQCAPRAEEGHIVRRSWWRRYDPGEVRSFGTVVISVDAAFKGGENNDFVAVEVWAKRGNDYFCRWCLNRHMDFPQTVAAVRAVKKQFPEAGAVLIEDKANGPAVISVLQREMFCIPVTPKGGKEARVHAVSPAIESGHVFLPAGESWTAELVDQFAAFPAGRHDDMVDSATQALSWLIWRSGRPPETAEQEDGAEEKPPEEALLDNERCYDIY